MIRAAVMLSLVLSFGCRQATALPAKSQSDAAAQADAEDVPITAADVPVPADFAEAVKRLGEYRNAIRDAVSSGHRGQAHRPLDELNIALERLPAIARSSGVPRREWEEIVVAGDDLAEALAAVHAAIDAGQSPDYASHAKAIDDALARLQSISERGAERNDKSAEHQQ